MRLLLKTLFIPITIIIASLSCKNLDRKDKTEPQNLNSEAITQDTETRIYGKAVCRTDKLRIRSIPSVPNGESMGTVALNEELAVLARSSFTENIDNTESCWYLIEKNDSVSGWVFGGYLEVLDEKGIVTYNQKRYKINPQLIASWFNEIEKQKDNRITIFDTEIPRVPRLGFIEIRGIYLWQDHLTVFVFNGKQTYSFLNLEIIEEIDFPCGGLIKLNENEIHISYASGRFIGSTFEWGLTLNLDSGKLIQPDKNDDFRPVFIQATDPLMEDNTLSLFEGYQKQINNGIYGTFIKGEQYQIYRQDVSGVQKVGDIPVSYNNFGPVIRDEHIVDLYLPKSGWADEDTVGPYLCVEYDYIQKIVIRKYELTEEEFRKKFY